jgi:hypothetical protein
MWSTPGKVRKGAALHVDESEFAGGMHDFQNKFAGVGGNQMEVVVILTGEETRIGFNAVEGARQARGFGRGDGRCNPGLWHAHGKIVSRERVRRQIRGGVWFKRCVLRMTGGFNVKRSGRWPLRSSGGESQHGDGEGEAAKGEVEDGACDGGNEIAPRRAIG